MPDATRALSLLSCSSAADAAALAVAVQRRSLGDGTCPSPDAAGRPLFTYGVTRGTFVAEADTYGADKFWVVLNPIPIKSRSTWRGGPG